MTGSDRFKEYASLQLLLRNREQALLAPLHVVADSNVLIKTVLNRMKLRQANARTDFEECADAGILVVYAPPRAIREVEKYIPLLAAERKNVEEQRLRDEWAVVRNRIHIMQPPRSESNDALALRTRDPDDVEFLELFEHLQLDAIISNDADWSVTSVPVFDWAAAAQLLRALRDYARAAGPMWARDGLSTIAVLGLFGTGKLLSSLPSWAQLLVTGAAATAVLYGPSRRYLWNGVERATDFFVDNAEFRTGLKRIVDGQKNLAPLAAKVREFAIAERHVSADLHALRVLIATDEILAEDRVGHAMQLQGWSSDGADVDAATRAALCARKEALEIEPKQWCLRPELRV